MAGVFKDDPQFEQMLSAIENYRNEIDSTIQIKCGTSGVLSTLEFDDMGDQYL
jgi:hypothetical protein